MANRLGQCVKRFALHQFPLILYAIVIFYISSLSRLPDTGWDITFLDKLAHAVEYFIFGLLAIRAFTGRSKAAGPGPAYAWAVLFSLLYGLSDEFHQRFVPGRSADPYDLMADAAGIFLALGFHYLLLGRRPTAPEGGGMPKP